MKDTAADRSPFASLTEQPVTNAAILRHVFGTCYAASLIHIAPQLRPITEPRRFHAFLSHHLDDRCPDVLGRRSRLPFKDRG